MARSAEAFVSRDLFEVGIGTVVFTRFRNSKAEAGVFLLDVFCLGVKSAFYLNVHELEYPERILDRALPEAQRKPIDPPSARKLVEGAEAFARSLGFPPHADYRKACRVFGGTKAEDAAESFSFGRNGKPFYVQGPSESIEKCLRVLKQLKAHCGEGKFDFVGRGGELEMRLIQEAGIQVSPVESGEPPTPEQGTAPA